MVWISSYETDTASWIWQLNRNLNCSFVTISLKIGFSHWAIILAIILYTTLQHEIGLKSLKEEGFFFLGMRVKKMEFRAPKTFLALWDSCMTFRKFPSTRSKKPWKNSIVKPSSKQDNCKNYSATSTANFEWNHNRGAVWVSFQSSHPWCSVSFTGGNPHH